jgi:hypothetical protein
MKKLAKAVKFQTIARVINGEKTKTPFGGRYYVCQPSPGAFEVLKQTGDDPSVVAIVPREELAAQVIKYCSKKVRLPEWQFTAEEADSLVKYWVYQTKPVAMPRTYVWPGETDLAFTRLPWPPVAAPAPTWDTLLGRMTNATAFRCWIGSLFDDKSYLQQYVWLYGKGNDGKGSINDFLSRVFGPAYCSKLPPDKDKFWSYELIGKRLVAFPDCDDATFVTSGRFKSLTGGDPIGVEAKGKMSYSVRLGCKYLVLSNEEPQITSARADIRRIIYCTLATPPEADIAAFNDGFKDQLWAEGGGFLGSCLDLYRMSCCGRGPIYSDNEMVSDVIENADMDFAEVFDFNFEIDMKDRDRWLPPENLQRVLKLNFKSRELQLSFLKYLEREKRVKKVSVRFDDGKGGYDVVKRYEGLTMKSLKIVEGQFSKKDLSLPSRGL